MLLILLKIRMQIDIKCKGVRKLKRKIYLYTNWDKQDLKCACLFFNPMCKRYKECEELEVVLDPYADLENTMKEQRKYKRVNGAIVQK